MDKDLQKNREEKKDGAMGIITYSSLGIVLLFIVELYLMISMPELLPAIAVVGIAIVGCAYLDFSTIMKRMHAKDLEQKEQYDSLLKSEKASYLLIRKYFDEIEEQLTLMEDKVTEPFQEIVAAQKATAKVTINRNKENAVALMNSNDKLLNIVFGMEEKIDQVVDSVTTITNDFSENTKNANTEYIQKQSEMRTEMNNQIRELELNVKNEILQAVNKLSSVSPQVVMASSAMPMMQQPMASSPVMNTPPENSFDSSSSEELGDLPDFTPLEAASGSSIEMMDMSGMTDMPEDEESDLPDMNLDIPDMNLDVPDMNLDVPDMNLDVPEMNLDLPEMNIDLPDLTLESEPEPAAEPEAELTFEPEPEPLEEPVKEEKPPMPDLSDPNKMMSPDDIAALLANMNSDETTAAPEAELTFEPELEPLEEPVKEEKPPMPDLSDPNKSMSPDEIAALFANLG